MNEIKDAILQALANVPYGRVCSYGNLAAMAGYPGYARYAGSILKSLPKDTRLPWHRIVNSQRTISFPEDSVKYTTQKQALEAEGITFISTRIPKAFFI